MPIADVLERLDLLSTAPSKKEALEAWLDPQDGIGFLEDNAREDEFVLYSGLAHTFMHALLVPARLATPPDVDDLISWSCNASSSWGVSQTFSPPRVWISPPLDHTGSQTLDQGEQLVFARFFEGRTEDCSYFEVLQKFVHVFGLHFIVERNAYCRLDRHGDLEEVIRIIKIPTKGRRFGGTAVIFQRGILDQYMAVTNSVLVRTFDFTRFRPGNVDGWSQPHDPKYTINGDIFYRSVLEAGHAGYVRGCQIVRPSDAQDALIRRLTDGDEAEKQYASFIVWDWKNRVVREISCAPDATANYFMKSDLPFEVSPAFFRPEVLVKYKSDSEKYRLDDRTITCRGAWHLKTFDVNTVGQVHTYLAYLRDLPYEEQLHWKAYNEKPKGPISERAYRTDFQGRWDEEYDPLRSLKALAQELDQQRLEWWTLREERLLEKVHYPVTVSADEWANELLQLDQLLVEGFEEKWLRQKAEALGRIPDLQWRSLRLVEECLLGSGFETDHAKQIVLPLRGLHDLRSKLKGHVTGTEGTQIKQRIRAEQGSYQKHFRVLCRECDESMRVLVKAFEKLK